MSVLTAVYVIATIIIVIYNRKSIKEIKETREAEGRPYVFVNLIKDARDMCFDLQIKNFGKAGARIVKLEFEPMIKIIDEEGFIFLENTIIAPNQAINLLILEKSQDTAKNDYKAKIIYESLTSKKISYAEEYELKIKYAHHMGHTDSSSSNLNKTENYLKNISEYLDSIRINMH
jgi:hypothetical protein